MSGYERVEIEKQYYINEGVTTTLTETGSVSDNLFYRDANYYSSKTVAENNLKADKLIRQLRRFAVEHNTCEIDWGDEKQVKYYIAYDNKYQVLSSYRTGVLNCFGQIYFISEEIAQQAMEKFKEELFWYFTEYVDHTTGDEETGCEWCEDCEKLEAMRTLGFEYCPKCGEKIESIIKDVC